MTDQSPLFKPAPKRHPTLGERTCVVCGGAGVFAAGFAPGSPEWCPEHVPPGFLPAKRKDKGQ